MVNSRCAHGLQEPFSPQPKAMSRLARNNRRRLETSILIILLVTSAVPPIGLVSTSMFASGGTAEAWSQTLAERLKRGSEVR